MTVDGVLASTVLLLAAGCSTSSPRGQPPFCVGDGGTFVCAGETVPGCPQEDMTGPCALDAATCTGCIGSSPAGYGCECEPAGNGTGQWLCYGTGNSCELVP